MYESKFSPERTFFYPKHVTLQQHNVNCLCHTFYYENFKILVFFNFFSLPQKLNTNCYSTSPNKNLNTTDSKQFNFAQYITKFSKPYYIISKRYFVIFQALLQHFLNIISPFCYVRHFYTFTQHDIVY